MFMCNYSLQRTHRNVPYATPQSVETPLSASLSPVTLNITYRQHTWKVTDSAVLLLKELKSQSIALAALQAVMSEEPCERAAEACCSSSGDE